MEIYKARSGIDRFYSLVTDDFMVLVQVRVKTPRSKCLTRNEIDPDWRWITRAQAARMLRGWLKARHLERSMRRKKD